jgi:hypothetical protein
MVKRTEFRQIPEKYEIATEVLSSTVRVLKSLGFSDREVVELFEQAIKRGIRAPIWLERLAGDTAQA